MSNGLHESSWILTVIVLIVSINSSLSYRQFSCATRKGADFPTLPPAYSSNIKINFETNHSTTEVRYAVNGNNASIEFFSKDRHVRYIQRGDQKCVLLISYRKNSSPTCVVKKTLRLDQYLEKEDAGPQSIVIHAFRKILEKQSEFIDYGVELENGVFSRKWEGCFTDPKVNVAVSFAGPWSQPFNSDKFKESDLIYITQVEAQITGSKGTDAFQALYSRFDPNAPDESLFQPPENVYCEGFQADRTPPSIPDYFSYNAETAVDSPDGKSPIVSYSRVFYDYEDKISRNDIYVPLTENWDSPITAQEMSVIHDFNAGVGYQIDPLTGKCTQDNFDSTIAVIFGVPTKKANMLTGSEYFLLDKAALSYNGQFLVRGIKADVFTSRLKFTANNAIVSWYFDREDTRMVQTEKVGKPVLLRMAVRPETGNGRKQEMIINFYNFARTKPDPFKYDLRMCFNESFSKVLVFTFPAIDLLKGSEKLVGRLLHEAITNVTGVSKHRVYINEVDFDKTYLYAEFDIMEAPTPVDATGKSKAISLADAVEKLKKTVANREFVVRVQLESSVVLLEPEPNGLNVFAGDRSRNPPVTGYKEGSVVLLTIGMLLLGILLGVVTLNLVMSKKFGVSLFQKSRRGNNYSGELNEGSI